MRGKERIVAKPVLHYGKWRIRWTDSSGRRQSQVFSSFEDAEIALRRLELEQLEIKHGGIRPLPPLKSWYQPMLPFGQSNADQPYCYAVSFYWFFASAKIVDDKQCIRRQTFVLGLCRDVEGAVE